MSHPSRRLSVASTRLARPRSSAHVGPGRSGSSSRMRPHVSLPPRPPYIPGPLSSRTGDAIPLEPLIASLQYRLKRAVVSFQISAVDPLIGQPSDTRAKPLTEQRKSGSKTALKCRDGEVSHVQTHPDATKATRPARNSICSSESADMLRIGQPPWTGSLTIPGSRLHLAASVTAWRLTHGSS